MNKFRAKRDGNGNIIPKQEVRMVREQAVEYESVPLKSPSSMVDFIESAEDIRGLAEERAYVLAFDNKLNIISYTELSKGTLNMSIVEPRDVFKYLLLANAHAFVLIHNHPSGETSPSPSDDRVTERFKITSKIMGLKFLDHIIVGNYSPFSDYYSYMSDGKLE